MSRSNRERRERERLAPRVEAMTYSPFSSGQTYEQANWSRLSPGFRDAHNRWRTARGLPAIPPPAVDLYVAPKETPPVRVPGAEDAREAQAAAREFLRPAGVPMLPGDEGFTINGVPQKLDAKARATARPSPRPAGTPQPRRDEGFSINGVPTKW
jgi:hypothetical protein